MVSWCGRQVTAPRTGPNAARIRDGKTGDSPDRGDTGGNQQAEPEARVAGGAPPPGVGRKKEEKKPCDSTVCFLLAEQDPLLGGACVARWDALRPSGTVGDRLAGTSRYLTTPEHGGGLFLVGLANLANRPEGAAAEPGCEATVRWGYY